MYNKASEQLRDYLHEQERRCVISLHVIPEPRTCKKFGCGKTLTRQESLYGDICFDCHGRKVIDIMDVLKMK